MAGFFDEDSPHGKVKRVMWFKYLQAFIAKTQQSTSVDKTIICDVFAGTGVYENNWSTTFTDYGSPLIALRAAIGYFVHRNNLPNTFKPILDANPDYTEDETLILKEYKIDLYFVEKDGNKYESLVNNIILFFNFHGINVIKLPAPNRACVSSMDEDFPIRCYIFNCEFVEFTAPDVPDNARMVTFIDPFGFAMIPWQKVSDFVGEHKELYITLMTSFMHRFFTQNRDRIGEVFGMEPEVLEILRIEDESHFVDTLADLYVEKLGESSDHALTFEMRDIRNRRLYHLIFATSHIEGLKSMKKSFNRGTQEQNTFSLSDFKILRKNIPLNLGNQQTPEEVAKVIFDKFKGEQVRISKVERFVWLDTPYVYLKEPLANLETEGKIVKVVGKNSEKRNRRNTFPDHTEWLITFASVQPRE
ncbi:uncharacterized protein LOC116305417 [Actinia tenebrosa]|uniref:Uncharacterized protein LOC116293846 n=1 Tax=Actinia tenebrosa TaxID=6105 RepID=A0A6P8HLB9_ACTTE|nr:uncharacterized protein LOC116293846 [Actinia tenebrosa]XP_031571176.1 uncharacterized protein LOC116305417 [Actinia tenebrosa]